MLVFGDPLTDQRIKIGQFLVQGDDFPGEGGDDLFPEVLGGDGGVLGFRGVDGGLGDCGGGSGAVFLQPSMESGLAGAADPVRRAVSGQQQQSGLGAAVVKCPLQRGEVLQQLGLQAVDRPHPVRGFVRTPRGEDPQARADLIPGPQRLQVPAHPGLVRDHGGVLGIRFAFPAVELGGVVHDPARDVEDVLAVSHEDGDQQRGAAVVQVRRPEHNVPVGPFQDGGDELKQGWFVVGDFLREQPLSVGIDHDAGWRAANPTKPSRRESSGHSNKAIPASPGQPRPYNGHGTTRQHHKDSSKKQKKRFYSPSAARTFSTGAGATWARLDSEGVRHPPFRRTYCSVLSRSARACW